VTRRDATHRKARPGIGQGTRRDFRLRATRAPGTVRGPLEGEPMASPHLLEATDANFQAEVLGSTLPVLVDFWATWCAPCRAIAPSVEDLAKAYEGKVRVAKLDVDSHPDTAAKYNVMSIPTLILFKDGKPFEAPIVGGVPKVKIEQLMKRSIA
jgi:thioredoxin 1